MKKQLLSRKRLSTLFYSLCLLLCINVGWGQTQYADGDYRSAATPANWNTVSTWQVRSGGSWATASSLPTASKNVFIQAGHTITMNATVLSTDGLCNNLHLNTAGVLAISGAFNVQVNGKIRAWTGAAVVTTGVGDFTDSSTTVLVSAMLTTSSTGVLKFVGNTRTITTTVEWNSSGTSNAAEFALNPNQTGSLTGTGVKFNPIVFSSGIISTDSFISVSGGDLTIKSGAKLITSRSSTNGVIGNSSSAPCGIVTIESGGILELTGSAPTINCTSFVNNGTVIYNRTGTQTLLAAGVTTPQAGTTAYNNYSTLILSGTSTKTLTTNTTIANSGSLSLQGTASLALGAFTLTYGTSTTLEYARTSSTTVGVEWPATSGPANVSVNSFNVAFSNTSVSPILRTITGTLTLNGAGGFTVDDNSGNAGTVPNILTFVNGSKIVRLAAGAFNSSGGTYVYGTSASDVIGLEIGSSIATPITMSSSSEIASSPAGLVNLTIFPGFTYNLSGNRSVNRLNLNGNLSDNSYTLTVKENITGTGIQSSAITQWTSLTSLSSSQQIYFGNNIYSVSTSGTSGTVAPTHTTGAVTATGGTAVLTYLSTNTPIPIGIGRISMIGNTSSSSISGATFGNLLLNDTDGFTLTGSPTISGVLTLTLGTLTTGANTLTLGGTPVVTGGSIVASNAAATVTFANASAVILPASLFTGNVQNLTINGGGGVTLGSATSLAGKLTLTAGTLNTGGFLTLKSSECCTATVSQVTDGSIRGNVIVERNIPTGDRAYRLLSPATTGGTINANWQEGGLVTSVGGISNPNLTYGTHITGTGGSANGFDTTTSNAASVFTYNNATPAWIALANTNGTLSAGSPYLVYIRGSRAAANISATAANDATTLRTTGTLTTGTVAVSGLNANANGFSLVGNPYQAQVDMKKVLVTNATAVNLASFYYVVDPKLGSKGAYATVDLVTPGNSTAVSANQYLQPGQACFVQTGAASAASFSFTEADKFEGTQTSVFRTKDVATSRLLFTLNDFTAKALDRLVITFDANDSNEVNNNDASKLTNFDESLASSNSSKLLAIEKRAIPTDSDEIPLNITKYRGTSYTLRADASGLSGPMPYLFDNYTSTTTEIPLDGSVNYAYTVDAGIPASIAADRFKLIYGKTLKTIDNELAGFALYPNPSKTNSFSVVVPQTTDKVSLTVSNLLGQKLYSQNDLQSGATVKVTVNDVKTSGVYLVSVTAEGKTATTKWIVQ